MKVPNLKFTFIAANTNPSNIKRNPSDILKFCVIVKSLIDKQQTIIHMMKKDHSQFDFFYEKKKKE